MPVSDEEAIRKMYIATLTRWPTDAEMAAVRPWVDIVVTLNTNTGAYLSRNIGAVFANAPILLFVDDDAMPGLPEGIAGQHVARRGDGLIHGLRDDHALARREAVGLHDVEPVEGVEKGEGWIDRVEGAVRSGGHTGLDQHLLHPGLRALEPRAVRTRPERRDARGTQGVERIVQRLLDLGLRATRQVRHATDAHALHSLTCRTAQLQRRVRN